MENPFSQRMARLSNTELQNVLRNRPDYVPLALVAAEQELLERGLDVSELEELREIGEARAEEEKKLAQLPLEAMHKAGYFFFAFLILTPFVFFFYRYWDERGYRRRSVESIQQVSLGLLFYYAVYMVCSRLIFA